MSTISQAAGNDSALQSQIAALRESLHHCRSRAYGLWKACASEREEERGEARLALGRYTQKLLQGQEQLDEAYG